MPRKRTYDLTDDSPPPFKPPGKRVKRESVLDHSPSSGKEKRLARFRANCPKNIIERVERVYTQRFFLVDRERTGDELREVFKVLGSTGNVYEVVIDKVPTCTCPDAIKGNHCKHLLFVFLKVLNTPDSTHFYYQKALITTELQAVFAIAKPNPRILAPQSVRDAYSAATGSPSRLASSNPSAASSSRKRKNPNGDDCAICYEAMEGDDAMLEKSLVWCERCDNAIHKECFAQWCRTAGSKGGEITCVYCRAPWPKSTLSAPAHPSGNGSTLDEGYLNLGSVAGVSRERDTSSYYSGPRGILRWSNSSIVSTTDNWYE